MNEIAGLAAGVAGGLALPAALISWESWLARVPARSLTRLLRGDLARLAGHAGRQAWVSGDGAWQFSITRVWGITVICRRAAEARSATGAVTYCIVPLIADILTWPGHGLGGDVDPLPGRRSLRRRMSPWAAVRMYQWMALMASTGTVSASAAALLELVAQMAVPAG